MTRKIENGSCNKTLLYYFMSSVVGGPLGVGGNQRVVGGVCDVSCRRWGSTPTKVKDILPPEPPLVS